MAFLKTMFVGPKTPKIELPPPQPTPQPVTQAAAETDSRTEEERKKALQRARAGGRAGTILTSAQGVAGQPDVKKTLLG